MAIIHDLPPEVLNDIFRKACEESNNTIFDYNRNTTVRHPLIMTCRQVCWRWRQILDTSVPKDYKKQFCTYLALMLRDSDDKPSFTQQLRAFSKALATNKGAQIWARFNLQLPRGNHQRTSKLDDLSMNDATFLKLFIRGFEMMIPYRKQLGSLYVYADQPEFLAHVMRFLTVPEPITHLYRLIMINEYEVQIEEMEPTDSLLLEPSRSKIPELEWKYDLSKHIGLTRLIMNGSLAPFLGTRVLKLPHTLTYLEVPQQDLPLILDLLQLNETSL